MGSAEKALQPENEFCLAPQFNRSTREFYIDKKQPAVFQVSKLLEAYDDDARNKQAVAEAG